jgi:tetratricopeptide (TPR) repeat protein
MKKVIVCACAILLLLSTIPITSSAESIKVLVDESRVVSLSEADQDYLVEELEFSKSTDWSYSFDNNDEAWGLGTLSKRIQEVGYVDIKKSGKLSYNSLKNYDVLVIASFEESYSSDEAEAIKQFVENGGGLLLLAAPEASNNSISRTFDVQFSSETVIVANEGVSSSARRRFSWEERGILYSLAAVYVVEIEDFKTHPVTNGITEFGMCEGIPIASHKSGKVLATSGDDTYADVVGPGQGSKGDDEEEGPLDVLLAMEMGKGRAVFFSSQMSFWNCIVQNETQNTDLAANAVEWLGEPGGPYKQYKLLNEQAQGTLTNAISLYQNHKFSQAITECEKAIGSFEESSEIYTNADASSGIQEANTYIEKCNTGIEADTLFDQAMDYFNNRDYESAIEEFNKAQEKYQEIEYTERAQECTTKAEESNKWITLREEATQLLDDGEESLKTAPSTFSTSGYEESKAIFEQAKAKWEEYDDPEKVATCEEKIDLCNQEIARIEKFRMMTIIGVVVVVVVVIVVVVLLIKRKKPKATEAVATGEATLPTPKEKSALETLAERYAKGEITKEEYEKLKSVLEKE